MRRFTKKQYLVAGVAALVIAGTAGSAIAYWTSTGSGSGDATTSSSNTTTTVNQVSVPTNMAPGVAAGAVKFNVTNNSSTQSAFVNNVVISISSVTPGANTTPTHTCDASDYSLTQPTWAPVNLAPSATSSDNATATLAFNGSTTVNQDNCQGAVVHLAYTAS